jgi:eukaryotic-like serine/threonine-protein kinase
MIQCPDREQLGLLLANGLADTRRDELEEHVEGCALCQQTLDEITGGTYWAPEPPQGAQEGEWDAAHDDLLDHAMISSSMSVALDDQIASGVLTVPGYEIEGELGRGGMGVVYKARHAQLKRPCALKMILAGAHAGPELVARFRAEAEAIARLQHPHVVQIRHVGEAQGMPFFELEFVSGGSLDKQLDGTPWPAARAVRLAAQLTLGIAEAHRLGIVHRDLKPSNVLLSVEGAPKVTDFGLAKMLDSQSALTRSESVMGSPSYMAPEQALGRAKQADPRVDVYALGAILYELLTGRPPFRGPNALETLEQVRTTEPVPPSRLVPGLPRDIATICLKCLEKDPGKRYATALSLADDLERFEDGRPILARPIGDRERAWRWCRRNPTTAALAAGIALSLLLGTVVSTYFAVRSSRKAVEAEDNARQATQATDRASKEAQRAIEAKLLSDRRLYVAEMALAERAAREGHMDAVEQHLLATRPSRPDEPDLRGFEWYYLARLCESSLRTLRGHDDEVNSVAYSPDGRFIATSSKDFTLKLWNCSTGDLVHRLAGHTETVWGIAYSPDGQRIASASEDKTVRIWDTSTGQSVQTLRGHSNVVRDVAFSPDGQRIASASMDGTVMVWDAVRGERLNTLRGHSSFVLGVAYSRDGRQIASASNDRTVKLWTAATGQEALTLRGHSSVVMAVAFGPDGRRVATGSGDHTVKLWDAVTGQALTTLRGHAEGVRDIAFSPDGSSIASASADQTARIWDVQTGQEIHSPLGHFGQTLGVAYSPKGWQVATACADRTVRLWGASTGHGALTLRGHTGMAKRLAYSPDGRQIVSGGMDRTVKLWDAASGRELRTLRGHTDTVFDVAYRSDGRQIASTGNDGTVRLWDPATGRMLLTLRGHLERVNGVEYSPDGRHIASASSDKTVRVWDTARGETELTLKGHEEQAWRVAYSPDGSRIASCDVGGALKVWDAATGQALFGFQGNTAGVYDVAYSPDGRLIASSGGTDHTITLWDAATGHERSTLRGHATMIHDVAFSPDGRRIASTSVDQTVTLWDLDSGHEVFSLRGHLAPVLGVSFSPDGNQLASASDDGTVKIWDASPPSPELQSLCEARSIVSFLSAKSLSTAEILERIRRDPTLSEPARERALAMVNP